MFTKQSNRAYLFQSILYLLLVAVSSCTDHMKEAKDEFLTKNEVTITTRSSEALLNYPLYVYIFENAAQLKETLLLSSASEILTAQLASGNYRIVVLSGLDQQHYTGSPDI